MDNGDSTGLIGFMERSDVTRYGGRPLSPRSSERGQLGLPRGSDPAYAGSTTIVRSQCPRRAQYKSLQESRDRGASLGHDKAFLRALATCPLMRAHQAHVLWVST